MDAWPQQVKAKEAIQAAVAEGESPLVIMATGTGKTRVISEVADWMKQGRTLTLGHRGLLLDQIQAAMIQWSGLHSEREQANQWADWNHHTIVSTPATLRGERLANKPKNINGIIVDEAHRAPTPLMKAIYDHFDSPLRFGFTATADRPDGVPLYPIFTKIAYQYSLAQGIKDGYLSKIIGRRIEGMEIDLSGIRAIGSDFSDEDVAEVLEKDLVSIAHNIVKETAMRRKVLIFMPNVASSEHLARILCELGESADYVAGNKKDSGQVLAKFHSGELKYMAACQLVIEGYDEPGIDTIVMLRPTLSRILYSQAIGRGTRIAEGKDHCLLLEFTYNSNKHKLVSPFELIGDDMSERLIERAINETADDTDIDFMAALEEITGAQYDINAIVKRAFKRDFNFEYFNPLDIGDLIGLDLDKESTLWFEGRELTGAATQKQIDYLQRFMIKPEGMSKSQASNLIGEIKQKSYAGDGPVSFSQLGYLNRLYPSMEFPPTLTKAAASLLIASAKEKQRGITKLSGSV